jgi:hypothetical protein
MHLKLYILQQLSLRGQRCRSSVKPLFLVSPASAAFLSLAMCFLISVLSNGAGYVIFVKFLQALIILAAESPHLYLGWQLVVEIVSFISSLRFEIYLAKREGVFGI